MEIRNIAIIAHVDHGKTTLVDALLKAGGAFKAHQQVEERIMDSFAQEKERGITIYAKNASITYKETKINIVDTPGHADFGSEVERVLRTIDAVILLVDAQEGPMPQTKFVLSKSLKLGLPVLVVINKIDKSTAQPLKVLDLTFELFMQLGATEKQFDFPYMFTIAREGVAILTLQDERKDITPLLDFILKNVPPARSDISKPFCMQPATLSYDNFLGRIAIGRVHEGVAKEGQMVFVITPDGKKRSGKLSKIFTFQGLKRVEASEIIAGDIVALAGIPDIYVGETITTDEHSKPLPVISVDPPSLQMDFMVNDSPFAGREGKLVTSRHIREYLLRELESNVGLKIEMTEISDFFKVYGRGEMHLAVLIEDMRRAGFELQVSQPQVVLQEIDGAMHEPIENVVIHVPENVAGKVIEALATRKGTLMNMKSDHGFTDMEFEIPTRGLLGFRSAFVVLTRGEGTLYHSFDHYARHCGVIEKRNVGSMISGNTGSAVAYALWKLQERGPLFVKPGDKVYEGMIIGEYNQGSDLIVNPLKEKKLTNVRASGSDDAILLTPSLEITLEKSLEYIQEDEYVEITPHSIRLRKKYLSEVERKRHGR